MAYFAVAALESPDLFRVGFDGDAPLRDLTIAHHNNLLVLFHAKDGGAVPRGNAAELPGKLQVCGLEERLGADRPPDRAAQTSPHVYNLAER